MDWAQPFGEKSQAIQRSGDYMEHGGAKRFHPIGLLETCSFVLYNNYVGQFLYAGNWSIVILSLSQAAFRLLPRHHDVDLSAYTQILRDFEVVGFDYANHWHAISGNDLDISDKPLVWEDR